MFDAARNFLAKAIAPKPAKGGAQQTLVPVTGLPAMPTVLTPKVGTKQTTQPSYVPTTTFINAPLLKKDSGAAGADIAATARQAANTPGVIRTLARLTPDLSAAVNAYLRVGIPENYKVVARNIDGTINRDATQLAMSILRQMDRLPDAISGGYTQVASMRSLAESLGREIMYEGAAAMELVLDKNRLPYKFQPVSVSQIIFREDKNTQAIFPQQLISGDYIDLDMPTFFYASLDQDLLSAYAISPLEGAVQPVLAAAQFATDMRRICQRHVFPRYDISIDEEKLRARIPPEVLHDTEQLNAFMNATLASIQTVINGMNPEDAIVHFDFFTVKTVESGSSNDAGEFETVKSIYDEKVSTGAKVMPSILGHGSGSQNVASTETMIFMKNADGMIRMKLQEIFSKAITLSVRLFGMDVTVDFQYDSINLRPDEELESFRAMKQSRVLEQLSLGFLSDDEAALELTGELTPTGFKSLSGTGFFTPITGPGEQGNPAAGGAGDGSSKDPTNPNGKASPLGNKQGAGQQGMKPDTPSKPKGPQK